jgi:hypothetical protein
VDGRVDGRADGGPWADLESLERWQVHRTRGLHTLAHWNDKEWWYSGAWDARTGVYASWYFVRVHLVDQFVFSLFDPALGPEPLRVAHKMHLAPQGRTALSLRHQGRRWEVAFEGSAATGWGLHLRDETAGGTLEADLHVAPTTPGFTKFDHPLEQRYGLLHHFHNRVQGSVRWQVPGGAPARTWTLARALGYSDHCFGKVPRRTGWHWLAVQNERLALASLVNYGPHAQRYTQAFSHEGPADVRGRWLRLGQDVSFEQPPGTPLTAPWRVTGPDVDLVVRPSQGHTSRERIPPVVDVSHSELFVHAEGRVRLEGRWVETGRMGGVLEQHGGRW